MKCKFQPSQIRIQGQEITNSEEATLTLIDSTLLSNVSNYANNVTDSSNLLYVSGSFIVKQNIYQNVKSFMHRITSSPITAMTNYQSSETHIAIAIKPQIINNISVLKLQLYHPQVKQANLCSIENVEELIDIKFLDKKRLLVLVKSEGKSYAGVINFAEKYQKLKTIEIKKCRKISISQRKVYIILEEGLIEFDDYMVEGMQIKSLHPDISMMLNYITIDSQLQIILLQRIIIVFFDKKMHQLYFQQIDDELNCASCMVRIGVNVLVAFTNSVSLLHFTIQNNQLRFVTKYTYRDRIKGGIMGIQQSFDEMHLSLSVLIYERQGQRVENFMFNLSILSSEKKFINPFMRMYHQGLQPGEISYFNNVITSETYHVAGEYIVNYNYQQTLEKKGKFPLHECPKALAVHPLGHQFLCVFDTLIRFYTKVQYELLQVWTEQIISSTAKYSSSGLLAIAFSQEPYYQILLYNPYTFTKIKLISQIYLKYPIQKIQWCHLSTCLALYSNHDFYLYTLNGEKRLQFRDKTHNILTMEYQPTNQALIVSNHNKDLLYCRKIKTSDLTLENIRQFSINELVSTMQISTSLNTIFMGTQNGYLIWTEYPFQTQNETPNSLKLRKLQLHQQKISALLLSSNLKYLFIGIGRQGIFIAKIKKLSKYENMFMMLQDFEISNINFLQISSRKHLSQGREKLKNLLQKRKTSFNQLQELKKQWDMRRNREIRALQKINQQKELNEIDKTLQNLNEMKKNQRLIKIKIEELKMQRQKMQHQKEINYESQMLIRYENDDKIEEEKKRLKKKYDEEYNLIKKECDKNLKQIKQELQQKMNSFKKASDLIHEKVKKYKQKLQIEQSQEAQQMRLVEEIKRKRLRKKDEILQLQLNQEQSKLQRIKKQIQRYSHRKNFLEIKKRFFQDQHYFCQIEKQQLNQIKKNLELQLDEIQQNTHKKQKNIRKYFKQNQLLSKFKSIHQHLKSTTNRQIQFLFDEKQRVIQNIGNIQTELAEISQKTSNLNQYIKEIKLQIKKQQETLENKKNHLRSIVYMNKSMIDEIHNIDRNLTEAEKANVLSLIYNKYDIDKKLQSLVCVSLEGQENNGMINLYEEQQRQDQCNVQNELVKHEKHLNRKLQVFNKYTTLNKEQMSLDYLKYQAQNYNLIAECNIRKQQASRKKRVLYELVDSVKETQMHMDSVNKQLPKPILQKKTLQIPYVVYQKALEQSRKISKSRKLLMHAPSETSFKLGHSGYNKIRKLLEIQKVACSQKQLGRRIKTAMIKKKPTEVQDHFEDDLDNVNFQPNLTKPMTANHKRRTPNQHFTKNNPRDKSSSKPTTCTFSSKIKFSVAN